MRNIEGLTQEEKVTLMEAYRNGKKVQFRTHCHAILLSQEGYNVSAISALYKVRSRTVYTWFNRWESNGISGLIPRKGRGVKAMLDSLTKEQIEQVKLAIKETPQNLKMICENLSRILDFKVTKYMLKRLLKKT
jgi:transposase